MGRRPARPNGSFNFGSAPTSIPGDSSGNSGHGFASFLLGRQIVGLGNAARRDAECTILRRFFQDDWRISSKLTLNLGFDTSIRLRLVAAQF